MANTQGLCDEAAESLLSQTCNLTSGSVGAAAAARKRQARLLQQRIEELPVPNDRPAARVVNKRPIPKRTTAAGTPITSPFAAASQSKSALNVLKQKDSTPAPSPPPVVVGSIVERRVTGRRRSKNHPRATLNNIAQEQQQEPALQSRFAREQRQLQPPSLGVGFPSVNVPLGTFVNNNNNNNNPSDSNINQTSSFHPPQQAAQSSHNNSESSSFSEDAQAMLSRMSREEIQISVQELQSSLSPESIAFLKNRRKTKQQKQQKAVPTHDKTTTTTNQGKEAGSVSSSHQAASISNDICPTIITADLHRAEKERIAHLLSSVKTYEDLDAAYAAEMGDGCEEIPTGLPLLSAGVNSDQTTGSPASTIMSGGTTLVAGQDHFLLACDLLRSTAPRQNLWAARTVYLALAQDWNEGKKYSILSGAMSKREGSTPAWPYPTLLPVSLRCLLDTSYLRVNGYVLHTYVLQSLHLLLRLRVCVEHDVDVTGMTDSAMTYFQTVFMDDAVPTPDPAICYSLAASSSNQSGSNHHQQQSNHHNSAYSSESSSESAKKDGDCFARDPLGTLLSKMQIVPRLGQLVHDSQSSESQLLLPQEAIVAICGISAILGQRSSAAATNIVRHASLLTDLIDFVTVPSEGSSRCNPAIALPVVILLSVLARQSREAAQGLVIDQLISGPILVQMALNDAEFRLQRQTIILWRTLLRYGLGLTHLQTMLTVAAPHIALGFRGPRSLSADFVSCFALVARVVVAAQKAGPDCFERLEEEQRDILSVAGVWLSSSARPALAHLASLPVSTNNKEDIALELQAYASCLGFLDVFCAMGDPASTNATKGEVKTEEISTADEDCCVSSLILLIENEVIDLANSIVMPYCYVPDFGFASDEGAAMEAAAAAFLKAFGAFSMSLITRTTTRSVAARPLARGLGAAFARALEKDAESYTQRMPPGKAPPFPVPRRAWLNRGHVAALNFLQSMESFDKPCARTGALTSAILGRLEGGDEKLAVDLLQSSWFLRADLASSTLSKMLLRQMCRTSQAQSQLRHSRRIHDIKNQSLVDLSELESLRSHVESPGIKDGSPADHLLPVGEYWLWNLLASARDASSDNVDDETRVVLADALGVTTELEEADAKGTCHYAGRLNPGAKMYFLMNLCLQSEECLHDLSIVPAATELLLKFSNMVDEDFASGFAMACFQHSSTGSFRAAAEAEDLSAAEKKMASILDEEGPGDSLVLPARVIRCVKDFLVDLITTFIEYGAQYDFFTGCLRIFLFPAFPTKIRCEAVIRLKGLLHLFTLEMETDALIAKLEKYMPCSVSNGKALCDTPEFVDALVSNVGDVSRPDARFIHSLTVAVLALVLVQVVHFDKTDSRYEVTKQRFRSVPMPLFIQTFQTSATFLVSAKQCTHDLALAAVEASKSNGVSNVESKEELDEPTWDRVINTLTKARAGNINQGV